MTEERAIELATSYIQRKDYGNYVFLNATLHDRAGFDPDLPPLQASCADWIVRFQRVRANRNSSVIEDGDQFICVSIDPESGAPKLLKTL